MSPRTRTRAGGALLRLYPLSWQRRYGEEMGALLAEDPPSARGLATLVSGALRAHARPGPWRTSVPTDLRARLSLWALFACWIALSVAGGSFQKETEEGSYALAAARHGLLGFAKTIVIAGAVLGAVAIAAGGLPLLWQALREARSGGRMLRIGLALPLVGLVLFAGVTAALLAVSPSGLPGTSVARQLALTVPWWTAGAAFALACALAPRIVLLRIDPSPAAVRRASYAGLVLLVAMALVTLGLVLYCAGLVRLDPPLAAQGGEALWPSTALVLAAGAALAAASTGLAAVSASRAFRAARA